MIKVLDSFALLAFFEKEPCYRIIEKELQKAAQGQVVLLMSVVNWGEIYYIVDREYGNEKAEQMADLVEAFPIEIVDADLRIAKIAAQFKSSNKISYADCFAAALAKINKAPLLTGDAEFKSVERDIKIIWL